MLNTLKGKNGGGALGWVSSMGPSGCSASGREEEGRDPGSRASQAQRALLPQLGPSLSQSFSCSGSKVGGCWSKKQEIALWEGEVGGS